MSSSERTLRSRYPGGTATLRATALCLAAITGPAAAGDWAVLEVNGRAAQGEPMFSFGADGALGGSTGCNRFSARGKFDSGWMVADGPVATTQMACPGEAITLQETRILSIFEHGFSVTYDPFAETLKLTGRSATVVLGPPPGDPVPDQPAAAPDPVAPSGDIATLPPAGAETPLSEAPPPQAPTLFDAAYVAVHGLSGRLNVRAEPSTGATIVGGVHAGALLSNKGCEERSDHTWCHVAHIGNGRPQGWVAAEYLKPAPAALRASEALFDGIGTLACSSANGEADRCDYGVARDPDGTGAVTVFLPDGSQQLLVFRDGALVAAGGTETGDAPAPTATSVGSQVVVNIGDLRLELPADLARPE